MDSHRTPVKSLAREFAKHAVGQTDPPKEEKREIVTKQQVEQLEKQLTKSTPKLELRPPGMRPNNQWDAERRERLAKMKDRLRSVPAQREFRREVRREV